MTLLDILAFGSLYASSRTVVRSRSGRTDMSEKVLARSNNNEYYDSAGATAWLEYWRRHWAALCRCTERAALTGGDTASTRRVCPGGEPSRVAMPLGFGENTRRLSSVSDDLIVCQLTTNPARGAPPHYPRQGHCTVVGHTGATTSHPAKLVHGFGIPTAAGAVDNSRDHHPGQAEQ